MRREGASATVTAAWISLVGAVVAALIGGVFVLAAAQRSASGGSGQSGAQPSSVPLSPPEEPPSATPRPSPTDDRPIATGNTASPAHETAGPADEPPGSTAEAPSPSDVSLSESAHITLVVGIRPAYNQLAEDLSLVLDGRTVAHWQASQLQPSLTLPLQLPTGTHRYSIRGTYQFLTPNGSFTKQAEGQGTVEIVDGRQYGMPFYPANQSFAVIRVG